MNFLRQVLILSVDADFGVGQETPPQLAKERELVVTFGVDALAEIGDLEIDRVQDQREPL